MNEESNQPADNDGFMGRVKRLLKQEPDSRDDLLEMLDDERWSGVLEKQELRMLTGVLQVSQMQVREVMIPRPDMVAVPAGSNLHESLRIFIESGHSRAPVFEDDLDDVKGMLYAKDLLPVWHRGEESPPISELMRPAYFVPETKRADILFKEMQQLRGGGGGGSS